MSTNPTKPVETVTLSFHGTPYRTVTRTYSSFTPSHRGPDILTTPFVFPATCTALPSFCHEDSTETLCVNRIGSSWTKCQPNLAEEDGGLSPRPNTDWLKNEYTAAVCPSGWVALDLGLKAQEAETYRGIVMAVPSVISTAWCCEAGDSLGGDLVHLYDGQDKAPSTEYSTICINSWGGGSRSTRTVTGGVDEPVTVTSGTVMYPPWHIEWLSRDTLTLSPTWPTLTSNMLIPTWTEGMKIKMGEYDNKGKYTSSTRSMMPTSTGIYGDKGGGGGVDSKQAAKDAQLQSTIMKIVLPVIFVCGLLLVTCWTGCQKAKKQRKREAQEREAAGGEAGVVEKVEGEEKETPLARGIREAKEEARETIAGVAKVAKAAPV